MQLVREYERVCSNTLFARQVIVLHKLCVCNVSIVNDIRQITGQTNKNAQNKIKIKKSAYLIFLDI
jgi:hypothetical protein